MVYTLHELQTAIEKNEVVIFIGAGVSIATTKGNSVTSWKGLFLHSIDYIIEEIAGKYDYEWSIRILAELESDDIDDLLAVASKIERILKRHDLFSSWLNAALGDLKVKDDLLIKAILNLNAPIITTNYDYLLEKVSGYNHATWRDSENIGSILKQQTDYFKNHIIHLHGYFDKPESVIMGLESYSKVVNDPKIQTFLKAIWSLKTIIFIGVGEGIADPNFENFRQWASTIFKNPRVKHYRLAIASEVTNYRTEHKVEEHIKVVSYGEKYEDLTRFIQSLIPQKNNNAAEKLKLTQKAFPSENSLSHYLTTLTYDVNAWSDFFNLVELVGRKKELDSLRDFAFPKVATDKNMVWYTIHGGHGVGKSRLAIEWLKELEKEKDWATGFVEYIPNQLQKITEYIPDKNTALVIDNVWSHDSYIWEFLYNIYSEWKEREVQIKILLVSHVNLQPNSINSSINKVLEKLTHKLYIDPYTNKRKILGLKIHPIADNEEKSRLFDLTSVASIESITVSDKEKLIEQCDGRPAFIALAGKYRKDWRNKLASYADDKLKKAAILFGNDGIRLLITTALAGTITDFERAKIAPTTNNISKLSELFSRSKEYLNDYIPALEPDLFAFEIIYAGLTNYLTKSDQNQLLQEVVSRFPDSVLARLTNMWREESSLHNKSNLSADIFQLIIGDKFKFSNKANVLEILFHTLISEMPSQSINNKFNQLAKIRATICANCLLLNENQSDEVYRNIITFCFHKNMPFDGWSEYLQEIHINTPITKNTRFYWASLIDIFIGSDELKSTIKKKSIAAKNEIYPIGSIRILDEERFVNVVSDYLKSPEPTKVIYSCFMIIHSCWTPKYNTIGNHPDILIRLIELIQSTSNSYVLAGSSAFRWIVKVITNTAKTTEIRKQYGAILINILLKKTQNKTVFDSLCLTIGVLYKTIYKDFEILSWFAEAPQGFRTDFQYNSPTKLIQKENEQNLLKLYKKPTLPNLYKRKLTSLFIKIDVWNSDMKKNIKEILADSKTTDKLRLEIIIRLAKSRIPEAYKLLSDFLNNEGENLSEEVQLYLLVCLLYFNTTDRLNYINNIVISGIDINLLKEERKYSKSMSSLKGTQMNILLKKINNLHIKRKGHLIHKLKAKDTTGRWAYYFVYVENEMEEAFLKAIQGDGTIDLENYGAVVASSYGEKPTPEVIKYLKDTYGFEV
ncbi:SIR2-like domain protein [Kordia sp. SMS9]|uniref:SIR2 family protein n=1 Tax=Kordia sp. SMS9 TaxID=2282170 RepID=UPI000E0DFB8F|nr:SIR2 family protein [Kordia sp. SMS9]AXG69826.1 SIR2-like domain protein [Kordia sp. SMS9]